MTVLHDQTDAEKRACILAAAERLFREIGYLKTTVADIARTLKMSPANVYRFFPSKDAIRQGVAQRLMSEVEEAALTAGLQEARGDAVVPIDADLQDPPELIPELVARWREGFEVVRHA